MRPRTPRQAPRGPPQPAQSGAAPALGHRRRGQAHAGDQRAGRRGAPHGRRAGLWERQLQQRKRGRMVGQVGRACARRLTSLCGTVEGQFCSTDTLDRVAAARAARAALRH